MIDVKRKATKLVFEKAKDWNKDCEQLEDDLHELINQSIQHGLDEYRNEQMNSTLKNISKKHQIHLEVLLRDILPVDRIEKCRGKTRKSGVRCSYKAGENGYCKFHQQQGEKVQPRCLPSLQLHNHGLEKMNVPGCPGCGPKSALRRTNTTSRILKHN